MVKFFKGRKKKNSLKIFEKNRCHSCIGHTIRHIWKKKCRGKTWTAMLKASIHNTEADSYRAMERVACHNSRGKSANQLKIKG